MNGGPLPALYAVKGDEPFRQVEPPASYWAACPILSFPTLEEIENGVGDPPDYPTDSAPELATLVELNRHRDDPRFLAADARNPLSRFLTDQAFFRRPPAGAVLRANAAGITTGLSSHRCSRRRPPACGTATS